MSMTEKQPLLQVKNLKTYFPIKGGIGRRPSYVHAVDGVSLDVFEKETLGLVGESGCGKTTLARSIIRIENVTSGQINFMGKDITNASRKELREIRKNMQIIFQDPYSSLDPRMTVGKIIEEPLIVHGVSDPDERYRRVVRMLDLVGLREYVYKRYIHEFSGGQRQRIGIARALVLEPELLICDEPVSALDVSVQAQILNLLHTLQKEKGLTYLFVSHDMSVIRHISDRILVLYLGQMMEMADKKTLFSRPAHPYTKALMEAVPIPDPRVKDQCRVLAGEIPSPIHTPAGCPFSTRCPSATDRCRNERPMPREIEPGHLVACHLYQEQRKETA